MIRRAKLGIVLLGIGLSAGALVPARGQVTVTTAPATFVAGPNETGPVASAPALATRRADNDATPTLLTLHYKNVPVEVVLQDMASQMGRTAQIRVTAPFPLVSIDAEKQSYWNVVTTLGDALRINVAPRGNGALDFYGRWRVDGIGGPRDFDPTAGNRVVSGPFLLTAGSVRHVIDFRPRPAEQDYASISINLFCEPHLRLMSLVMVNRPSAAVDELGHSLVPAAELVSGEPAPVNRSDTINLAASIRLAPPADVGRTIADVKGEFVATVLEKSATFTRTNQDWNERRDEKVSGMTVRFEPMTKFQGDWMPSVQFLKGSQTDAEWEQTNRLIDVADLNLYDAEGNPFGSSGSGGGRSADTRSMYIRYDQRNPGGRAVHGDAVKLVLRVPVELREVRIPYEFRNLPLR